MALSQKHPGLMVVPWFNRQEWNHVYRLLQTNTDCSSLKQVQEILQTWKTRTSNLPSGVEGTLMLLNVLLIDEATTPKFMLRAAYGMILVRFLNLCCSSGEKQGTFSESVKAHNIPEWIVNTRHDLAHKHNMPNISKLKQALQFCFDWVLKNYWEKQDETLISHYSVSCLTAKNLSVAIELYCQINSLNYQQHGSLALKTLGTINSAVKNKLDNFNKAVNLKPVNSIRTTLRQLQQFIKDNKFVVPQEQLKNVISQTVLSFGGFFTMRQDDCHKYKKADNDKLPEDYLEAWDGLLDLFLDCKLLVHFLKELFNVVNCSLYEAFTRNLASLWVFHILQRLLLTQLQKDTSMSAKENIFFKRYPDLKKVSSFSSCKKNNGVFDEIKELRAVVVENPNKYNLIFLSCLLHVCKYPENYIKDSVAIMDLVCNPVATDVDLSYLLQTASESTDSNFVEKENIQIETAEKMEVEIEESKCYRFERVKDTSIFRGCPLGVLGFQGREKDPWVNHLFRL